MYRKLIERVRGSRVRGIFRVLWTVKLACFDVHVVGAGWPAHRVDQDSRYGTFQSLEVSSFHSRGEQGHVAASGVPTSIFLRATRYIEMHRTAFVVDRSQRKKKYNFQIKRNKHAHRDQEGWCKKIERELLVSRYSGMLLSRPGDNPSRWIDRKSIASWRLATDNADFSRTLSRSRPINRIRDILLSVCADRQTGAVTTRLFLGPRARPPLWTGHRPTIAPLTFRVRVTANFVIDLDNDENGRAPVAALVTAKATQLSKAAS